MDPYNAFAQPNSATAASLAAAAAASQSRKRTASGQQLPQHIAPAGVVGVGPGVNVGVGVGAPPGVVAMQNAYGGGAGAQAGGAAQIAPMSGGVVGPVGAVVQPEQESAPLPPPKKGRTNTPWTPAEEQRLKQMRDAGNSWSEIAKVRCLSDFRSRTTWSRWTNLSS